VKLKVRDLGTPVLRERPQGSELVRYKIIDISGVDLNPEWKVIDVSQDYDSASKLDGIYYLTEEEYSMVLAVGATVKVIPVDETNKKQDIPLP